MENENAKRIVTLSTILLVSFSIWTSVAKAPIGQRHLSTAAIILPVYKGEELSAEAYLVKVIGQDTALLKRKEWKRLAPASLTKILTALVALEESNPLAKIVFSAEAKDIEEKTSQVKKGEWLSLLDTIRLLMVGSANDAAQAIAERVGRDQGAVDFTQSLAVFTDMMNKKAAALGMYDSYFQNPVGLDGDNHYSSAQDLARLAEYTLINYPEVWNVSREPEAVVYANEGREYSMKNTDNLLKEFPAILGSKTGFTEKAEGALLMIYPVRNLTPVESADSSGNPISNGVYPVRPDKTAIIVILRSPDRSADGRKIIKWLEEINPHTYP